MTGVPTVTMIGLIMMVASMPLTLITGAIDVSRNTFPGYVFIPIVMLTIGATLAFAGAL